MTSRHKAAPTSEDKPDDGMVAEPTYGPAFSSLTDKQKKFILAMAADPLANGTTWARRAGYSDRGEGAKVVASRLWANPTVQQAILEVARHTIGGAGLLLAAQQLVRIAADPKHKSQAKAIEMLLNRTGLPEVTEVAVTHTHLSGEALVERVRHVAARLGIDPQRLLNAPAIDITAGSPYGPTAQLAAIDAQTIDAEVVDEPDGDSGL